MQILHPAVILSPPCLVSACQQRLPLQPTLWLDVTNMAVLLWTWPRPQVLESMTKCPSTSSSGGSLLIQCWGGHYSQEVWSVIQLQYVDWYKVYKVQHITIANTILLIKQWCITLNAPIAGVHKIPGPGSHSPEKVYANKPCAPKFSMGIKHSDYLTPLIIEVQD